ncbi:MAG: hypothetical protein U1E65_01835 [Myxococcota bacterium]
MQRAIVLGSLLCLGLLGCKTGEEGHDAGVDTGVDTGPPVDPDSGLRPDASPADGGAPPPQHWCALPGAVIFGPGGTKQIVPGGEAWPRVDWVTAPPGFCVHYFGTVPNARQVRVAPGGDVFVASPSASTTGGGPGGKAAVLVLADDDHDGVADQPYSVFLDQLPQTQGLLFDSGALYYQDGPSIRRLDYTPGMRQAPGPGTSIVTVSPPSYISLLHWPRSVARADDGSLYFTNGSDQGEICYQERPFVGGVLKIDGSPGGTPVVKGLRNPIAIRCQRGKGACYGVEMALDYSEAAGGREKLYRIRAGDDQGYPCCATTARAYDGVSAQSMSGQPSEPPACGQVAEEVVSFHIGRSPMSLDFEPEGWPGAWRGNVFLGLHGEFGTWVGAKVVALATDPVTGIPQRASELAGGDPSALRDFATGWDNAQRAHGRPDDVSFSADGRLFVTNDVTGEILWFAPDDAPIPAQDGGVAPDAGPTPDAGPAADGGAAISAEMSLYELAGTASVGGQATAVKRLRTTARFHQEIAHDFDDRQAGLGCIADHYDARARPAPPDKDAGSLRIVGYLGGPLLGGGIAQNPIVCVRLPTYYTCIFPSGAEVFGAPFAAATDALGAGPISFGTSEGADFGALSLMASPVGTVTVAEDLARLRYDPGADARLHPRCSPACVDARAAIRLTALPASAESMGWPYSSVGEVRCLLSMSATLTIPRQAIAAMLGNDAALDTIITELARLPASSVTGADTSGRTLVVDTGRGVFGRAPR